MSVFPGNVVYINADSKSSVVLSKGYLLHDSVMVGKWLDDADCRRANCRNRGEFIVRLHSNPVEHVEFLSSHSVFLHRLTAVFANFIKMRESGHHYRRTEFSSEYLCLKVRFHSVNHTHLNEQLIEIATVDFIGIFSLAVCNGNKAFRSWPRTFNFVFHCLFIVFCCKVI